MERKRKPLAERFWPKVEKTDGCWLWRGGKLKGGYGMLGGLLAHRIAFSLSTGDIPPGMHVLHRCDNPPCVNPAHLFLGTHRDNMADKERKGRANHVALKREQHGMSKLTSAEVASLREMRAGGAPVTRLMTAFGVSQTTVRRLIEAAGRNA